MDVNPTLHGGGALSAPPPKVLVSGAFQSDLRDPKCWHNSCMIFIISFMKKKNFKIFSKFFSIFFSFLDTLNNQKDFFALLGQKQLTFIYLEGHFGAHVK